MAKISQLTRIEVDREALVPVALNGGNGAVSLGQIIDAVPTAPLLWTGDERIDPYIRELYIDIFDVGNGVTIGGETYESADELWDALDPKIHLWRNGDVPGVALIVRDLGNADPTATASPVYKTMTIEASRSVYKGNIRVGGVYIGTMEVLLAADGISYNHGALVRARLRDDTRHIAYSPTIAAARQTTATNGQITNISTSVSALEAANGTLNDRLTTSVASVSARVTEVSRRVDGALSGIDYDAWTDYEGDGYITVKIGERYKNPYVPSSGNKAYKYAIIPCAAGDVFEVRGVAGYNPKVWAFIDAEGIVLTREEADYYNPVTLTCTAPEGAVALIAQASFPTSLAEADRVGYGYVKRASTISQMIEAAISAAASQSGSELRDKKATFIGDSLTSANNEGWAEIIAENEGLISTNKGIGGTCIAVYSGRTDSIGERLQQLTEGDQLTDADYIILQGGANDMYRSDVNLGEVQPCNTVGYNATYDRSTFCGALEWMCQYLLSQHPDKRVGFIVSPTMDAAHWRNEFGDAVVAACHKWSVPCIDLRNEAGFNTANNELREKYGKPLSGVEEYSTSKTYNLDDKAWYGGQLYKANESGITGAWNAAKWMSIPSTNGYDGWHFTRVAYDKMSRRIAAWMKTL